MKLKTLLRTCALLQHYLQHCLARQVALSPDSISNPLPVRTDPAVDVIKPGTKLRVLCVGDSITVGLWSDLDGGDGNGFRLRLRQNLPKDNVVFVGTETTRSGSMRDGYFAAWSGMTIQYISKHVEPSLDQHPNIILLHAGTNDMSTIGGIAREGSDPYETSERLGSLIDQMLAACPDAVVLVAMIIDACPQFQAPGAKLFQDLVPGVVQPRLDRGHHVLAVNFTGFPLLELRDCVHPTNQGYSLLGDYWADVLAQVPKDWIQEPVGKDPYPSAAPRGPALRALWLLTLFVVYFHWNLQWAF